jgi:hypothetical protein
VIKRLKIVRTKKSKCKNSGQDNAENYLMGFPRFFILNETEVPSVDGIYT